MQLFVGVTVSAAAVWLVGALVNAAVIRIYTSKNSRVNKSGQREFPLMFAAIDLIAMTIVLPIQTVFVHYGESGFYPFVILVLANYSFLFVMYGYLFCLITATVDKFYAVYFPFKYRFVHKKIIKIAIGLVFGFNFGINTVHQFLYFLANLPQYAPIIKLVYGIIFGLVFVTIIVLYVLIVVKIIQNGRKFGRVERKPATE